MGNFGEILDSGDALRDMGWLRRKEGNVWSISGRREVEE